MRKSLVFVFVLLMGVQVVSAFAISTLYSENYPLRVKPGEVKETFFLLRNVVPGDSDSIVRSKLIGGAEIATLVDGSTSYDLPYGSDAEVFVRVQVPKDAKPGTRYNVQALFSPIPREYAAEGAVQLNVNLGASFPVLVVGETTKISSGKTASLTIEEDQGEIVETLAPFTRSYRGIWAGLIFFVIVGIIVIVYLITLVIQGKLGGINQKKVNDVNANVV
jgi:hypothetical protein